MTPKVTRAFSLGLRGSALISRYLLFFCLALYLRPEDVGLYGLIAATVGYASLAVGLDFYLYANREFKQADDAHKRPILRRSLRVYAGTYLLVLPLLTMLFAGGLLPWHLAGLFYAVLVLEHMGQEAYRILVMMEKTLLAGWVLFLRLGAWAMIFSIAMALNEEFRNLEMLLVSWCIGAFLSVFFAIGPIIKNSRSSQETPLENDWLVSGLKVAIPFLIGTLCLRGVVTIDRYLVEIFNSREVLGVYVFFAGMAAALPAFLEAGVFSFLSPKLIGASRVGDGNLFKNIFIKILKDTLTVSVPFILLGVLSASLIVLFLPNQIYADNVVIFYLCLSAQIPLSLSMVYHFALYARRHDRSIIQSHVVSFAVFIAAALLMSNVWPLGAVPIALIVANATLLTTKYSACRYHRVLSVR